MCGKNYGVNVRRDPGSGYSGRPSSERTATVTKDVDQESYINHSVAFTCGLWPDEL